MSLEEYADTVERVRRALGDGLRSLTLFGSCLSPTTRGAGSVPDLFALVDDLDRALAQLGAGRVTRLVAPILPPITLNFRDQNGTSLAKLNLVEPAVLAHALATLPDLYLAGRWSKRTAAVYVRDPAAAAERDGFVEAAERAMSGLVLLDVGRRHPLERAVERCVTLSYEAEPRPEKARRIRAVYEVFANHYLEHFSARLARVAQERGLQVEAGFIVDPRDESLRRAEARALRRRLGRSRRRMMMRWPKQALVYRGWLGYVVGKLRRARGT
jgi:hypothetical protein